MAMANNPGCCVRGFLFIVCQHHSAKAFKPAKPDPKPTPKSPDDSDDSDASYPPYTPISLKPLQPEFLVAPNFAKEMNPDTALIQWIPRCGPFLSVCLALAAVVLTIPGKKKL